MKAFKNILSAFLILTYTAHCSASDNQVEDTNTTTHFTESHPLERPQDPNDVQLTVVSREPDLDDGDRVFGSSRNNIIRVNCRDYLGNSGRHLVDTVIVTGFIAVFITAVILGAFIPYYVTIHKPNNHTR